eukprot:5199176-Alexandrium_andersonii.AAC.1
MATRTSPKLVWARTGRPFGPSVGVVTITMAAREEKVESPEKGYSLSCPIGLLKFRNASTARPRSAERAVLRAPWNGVS